ncbi:MAG: glycine cleavage system protein GcvH [Acidimicrobiia bacterium]|nr:glycine cleavage system protein GcvH [Acidimicrobiia bacterium]MDX2468074.1 glycine cleavage system protein GcvH [Acidimicrobiia bacterium]
MQIPEGLRYTENHEWVAIQDDGNVRVGITDFAQDALGDVVFVDLPEVGAEVTAGEAFAEIESTKSVADVYAPITGTIVAANEVLVDAPETINADPYETGWFVVIEGDSSAVAALMDPVAYATFSE